MKNKLSEIINKIIDLLNSCGYSNKAGWFKEKLILIEKEDINSEDFKSQVKEIKQIIAGMGSFTDLSLIPKPNSGISKEQAREHQWKLAEELSEIVSMILAEKNK